MISDGLPTECSTTALKTLVSRLSRKGICCAQVAVRPLSEVCFQHYVELGNGEPGELVRRFGGIVAKLVKSVRTSPEISGGLSLRATDEACMYVKHPLFEDQPQKDLLEILKSSFCGRLPGRWDDLATDAGAVWALLQDGKKRA